MPPPPRPPIICYDLHTNTNPRQPTSQQDRRISNGSRIKRPKITVIRKDANVLDHAKSQPLWNLNVNSPISKQRAATKTLTRSQNTNPKVAQRYERNLVDLQLSQFQPGVFDAPNRLNELAKKEKIERQNARAAYSDRLRDEAELKKQRLRSRQEKEACLRELDDVSRRLEAIHQAQENLCETYGLSHRAAKYFQKQDEENDKLKQKMRKFSEVRSRELGSRIRQMKRLQELNKQQPDKEPERDDSTPLTNVKEYACKSTSPLKTSLSSDSANHSAAEPSSPTPSSTISISSFSSISSDDFRAMTQLVKPNSKTTSSSDNAPILSSSFSKKSFLETKPLKVSTPNTHKNVSFFKRNPVHEETLEITDLDFFNKIEDRTMLEVNQLMNNLHAQLRE